MQGDYISECSTENDLTTFPRLCDSPPAPRRRVTQTSKSILADLCTQRKVED